jgi:hypothetical protein
METINWNGVELKSEEIVIYLEERMNKNEKFYRSIVKSITIFLRISN